MNEMSPVVACRTEKRARSSEEDCTALGEKRPTSNVQTLNSC